MVDGVCGGRERELRRQIRQLLAQLELMPHGTVTRFDTTGSQGFGPTAGRIPGGIDRRDDDSRDAENWHPQRSHVYFRRRYANAKSLSALEAILRDWEATLLAWRRTPPPSGSEPVFGSFAWKRWVANSDEPAAELGRRFRVSRQYIHKLRNELRDAA
jgi:hypothetical protein